MKKYLIPSVAVIIVAVVLVAVLINSSDDKSIQKMDSQPFVASDPRSVTDEKASLEAMQKTQSMSEKEATNFGKYFDYDPEKFNMDEGRKILFFHASWCPQCRSLDASINTGPLPQDVNIYKVDFDNSQELRQKYGVTLQTTIVFVDESDNLIKKVVAYDTPTLSFVKSELSIN